mmetsp:Transcript_52119/g.156427  ORF Transcript_52119/g.156427 Transcript_52119/m.156427 type:complete len:219 (+) Transcript_52119:128-784(+)
MERCTTSMAGSAKGKSQCFIGREVTHDTSTAHLYHPFIQWSGAAGLLSDLNLLLVPHGVVLLPVPGVLAHLLDPQIGLPLEHIPSPSRIGVQCRNVPRPSGGHLIRHRLSRRLGHALHELQHRNALPRPEINRLAPHRLPIPVQPVQRRDVPLGEVDDVDVIPHARPVGGVVVVPEHAELLPPPDAHLRHEGHEVIRDALRILPDPAARMRPDGVEVT